MEEPARVETEQGCITLPADEVGKTPEEAHSFPATPQGIEETLDASQPEQQVTSKNAEHPNSVAKSDGEKEANNLFGDIGSGFMSGLKKASSAVSSTGITGEGDSAANNNTESSEAGGWFDIGAGLLGDLKDASAAAMSKVQTEGTDAVNQEEENIAEQHSDKIEAGKPDSYSNLSAISVPDGDMPGTQTDAEQPGNVPDSDRYADDTSTEELDDDTAEDGTREGVCTGHPRLSALVSAPTVEGVTLENTSVDIPGDAESSAEMDFLSSFVQAVNVSDGQQKEDASGGGLFSSLGSMGSGFLDNLKDVSQTTFSVIPGADIVKANTEPQSEMQVYTRQPPWLDDEDLPYELADLEGKLGDVEPVLFAIQSAVLNRVIAVTAGLYLARLQHEVIMGCRYYLRCGQRVCLQLPPAVQQQNERLVFESVKPGHPELVDMLEETLKLQDEDKDEAEMSAELDKMKKQFNALKVQCPDLEI